MKRTFLFFLGVLFFGLHNLINASERWTSGIAATSIRFTENKGQVSDQYFHPRNDVLFSSSSDQLVLHLKANAISYQLYKSETRPVPDLPKDLPGLLKRHFQNTTILSSYRLDVTWKNANQPSSILRSGELKDVENFYLASCPQGIVNVKSYTSIEYKGLYPGIDYRIYSKGAGYKYDYHVKAGADYKQIVMVIEGATNLSISGAGDLLIETPFGILSEKAPLVLQDNKPLPSKWIVRGNEVSFEIEAVDSSKDLLIDPLLRLWGTYYGGSAGDNFSYIQVDGLKNSYTTGYTKSPSTINIASTGAHQTTYGGAGNGSTQGDAFIAKFGENGQRKWATYYGGSGSDFANNCAIDLVGNVYMGGATMSPSVMATPAAHQTAYVGGSFIGDAFLVKFDSNGVRQWGTYYGGSGNDWILGVCLLPSGEVAVCGGVWGGSLTEFGTTGSYQSTGYLPLAGNDAFLSLFSSSGVRIWSTYYAGSGKDNAHYCQSDIYGNIYIGGATTTTDVNVMAVNSSFQPSYGGGSNFGDAFLAKFDPLGTRLWATYIGGSGEEYIDAIKVDKFGFVYLCGITSSPTSSAIASTSAYQGAFGGSSTDVYLAKFDANGNRIWGTYYGGNANEDWPFIDIDIQGNVILCGYANNGSANALVSSCAYQLQYGGGNSDLFFAKFLSNGSRVWADYFGGTGTESYPGVACDAAGNFYLAASTTPNTNSVIITNGAHQSTYGGGAEDVFIVKWNGCRAIPPTLSSGPTICKGQASVLQSIQNCGVNWYSDSTLTQLISSQATFTTGILNHDTTFYLTDVSCGTSSPKAAIHLSVVPSPTVYIVCSNGTSITCRGDSVYLNPYGANSYTWTNSSSTYSLAVSPSVSTIYTVTGKLFNGCSSNGTFTLTVDPCVGLESRDFRESVRIYPNPGEGVFQIETHSKSTIRVMNSLGHCVYRKEFENPGRGELNLSHLANGVYLIECLTEQGPCLNKLILSH